MIHFLFCTIHVVADVDIGHYSLQPVQRLRYTFRYPLMVLSVFRTPSMWLRS